MTGLRDETFGIALTDADSDRLKLVPYVNSLQRTIIDLLPEPDPETPLRILDLGPSTGLLAERILRLDASAELTVLDLSDIALANVRSRLAPYADRVTITAGDYVHTPFDGPYDVIIAELSVHHLKPRSLRTLFSASFAALRRGGIFIDADQVRGETEEVEDRHMRAWRRDAILAGAPESEIDEAIELHLETRPPTLVTVMEQLSSDGYENVCCDYKKWCFAVVSGAKL